MSELPTLPITNGQTVQTLENPQAGYDPETVNDFKLWGKELASAESLETAQVRANVNALYRSGDIDQQFARWENGFEAPKQPERWDLEADEPVVAFDPDRATAEAPPISEAPEFISDYDKHTRALEKVYQFMDHSATVADITIVTRKAVIVLRKNY